MDCDFIQGGLYAFAVVYGISALAIMGFLVWMWFQGVIVHVIDKTGLFKKDSMEDKPRDYRSGFV